MPGTKRGCLCCARKRELKSARRMSVSGVEGEGGSAGEVAGKMVAVAWR